MGLREDLGKALKKVEDEVKKSAIEKQLNEIGQGLNRSGNGSSPDAGNPRLPAKPVSPATVSSLPVHTSTAHSVPRSPSKGYAKIAAWMKRTYRNQISTSIDSYQQGLQLEQLTAEACSGLPAKAKKGFVDYLKKLNYEPLLK